MIPLSLYYLKIASLSVAIVLVAIAISPFIIHSQEGAESAEDFVEEVSEEIVEDEVQEVPAEPESEPVPEEPEEEHTEEATDTEEVVITDVGNEATTTDGTEVLHIPFPQEEATTTASSSTETSESATSTASSTASDVATSTASSTESDVATSTASSSETFSEDPFATSVELTPLTEAEIATPEIQQDLAQLEIFTTTTDALPTDDATTTASTTGDEYLEIVLEELPLEEEIVEEEYVLAPPSPEPPPLYESPWQRYLNKVFALDDEARHTCTFESDVNLTEGGTQDVTLLLSNRNGSMGELEVGNTPNGVSVLFNGEDSYVQFWSAGPETRLSIEVKRTLWAQEGMFNVPVFYTKGSSTTVCQLIIINGVYPQSESATQEVLITDSVSETKGE